MSDSLFGGSTSTVAEVSKQLAEISKSLDKLSADVSSKRNSNLLADAVVMPGECPTGLVGCNANELYTKTGGELTCPPLEQAPDPIITDHKGRICYAPESLKEQWKGKNLNIKDLMEKYALKLVKMLENSNNLAIAVETARSGPKGSPIILNFYANNPFVRSYAARETRYGLGVARAGAGGFGSGGLFRGIQAFDVNKETLAALVTKFSTSLDPDSGSILFSNILSSAAPNGDSPVGIFDTANVPVHSIIADYLLTAVVATQRDSTRRSKLVDLLNGLAESLKFGELSSIFHTPQERVQQGITAANAAVTFLPKAFRDWMASQAGVAVQEPRIVLLNFVLLSIVCTTVESFNSKVSSKYINAVKALRVAFDNMRKLEYQATQLLEEKAKGNTVLQAAVDQALRDKKGAAQAYVVQTVKFGTVVASLLGVNTQGGNAFLEPIPSNMVDASRMMRSLAEGVSVTDPLLSASITTLRNLTVRAGMGFAAEGRQRTMLQTGFGYIITGRAGFYRNANGAVCLNFFNRVITFSKFTANTVVPEEEVVIPKIAFDSQATAQAIVNTVKAEDKAKFAASLPANNKGFCKVKVGDNFVYIHTRAAATPGTANLEAIINNIANAIKVGNLEVIKTNFAALGNISSQDIAYLVNKNCQPISDEDYAYVRKMVNLAFSPAEQMIRTTYRAQPNVILQMENGLTMTQRDAFSVLLIILFQMSGNLYNSQVAASMINAAASPIEIALFVSAIAASSQANKEFASHGSLAGGDEEGLQGGEIEGGDEESLDFSGGDDWENAAEMLLNGGAVGTPAHSMPSEIQKAVRGTAGNHGKGNEQLKKVQEELAKKGYHVTYFDAPECPSYIRSSNNTFGTPGEKRWVETKHPWAKCQEQMGFQFVTKNGFCYPYGMTCYPEDDLVNTTQKTVETVDNWIQLAKIYNSVQQKKYMEWMEGEKARIRSEPQNEGMTDKEVEDLAKSHLPPEYAGLPEYGAVKTLVTLSTQIEDAVSEITSSSDSAQREAIKKILRNTGSMRDMWSDEDKKIESMNLDRIAASLVKDAKDCTTASIDIVNNVAPENVSKALTAVTTLGSAGVLAANGGVLPAQLRDNSLALDKTVGNCTVLKTGDKPGDAVLIPNSVNQHVDLQKLAQGEPVDPIVNWWRTYYGTKAEEEAKRLNKIASKLSPFETRVHAKPLADVPKARGLTKDPEKALEAALEKALGTKGVSILERQLK